MLSHWTTFVICLLVVHFHPILSRGNPIQKRLEARPACKVYGIFNRFGSSEIPRCDLQTACSAHSDCLTPGFKCECNSQCGMVCACPPARSDVQQYRVGGLVTMTRCSGRRKCTNISDCASLSTHGVRYECVCTEKCGQVCQGIPIVPNTRPGRCPKPRFVYDFMLLCRMRSDCVHDAHCVDNENMKCCQSMCGKKCMLAVSDVDPSLTPRSTTTTSSTALIAMPSSEVHDEGLEVGFENVTDVTTDVTTNFEMTLETLDDDPANEDHNDQNNRNSKNQRSSRETGRCRTGLRQRNRPGGGRRRCNSNHPCYVNGHHPLCGSNGVSYANECYLLREQDRLGVQIAVNHRGYCEQEYEGRGGDTGTGLSKRRSDTGSDGCGIYTHCDNTKLRDRRRDEDDNFI